MSRSFVRPLAVAVAAAVLVVVPVPAQDGAGRKIALLVGVEKYDGTGLRNLDCAEKDVTDLRAVLEKLGYTVTLLTRSEFKKEDKDFLLPTAANVRDQLRAVVANRRPADTVLVAFSGHGAHLKKTNKLYYCPTGTNLEKEDTLVAVDDILAAFKDCGAGSKVLLMDACRNDPADGRTGGLPDPIGSITRPLTPDLPGGTVALFSCSKGQIAYESGTHKRGFLFHFVIEGLNGKAANKRGEVSWLGLARYVEDELPDAVRQEKGPKAVQVPEVKGVARGLVLATVDADLAQSGPSKTLSVDLGGGEVLELIRIDPRTQPDKGVFTMGSTPAALALVKMQFNFESTDEPGHECKLTKPYYLGKYEVTRGQFRAFVEATKYETEAEAGDGGYGWDEAKKTFGKDKKYTWRNLGFPQTDAHPVANVSWNDAVKFCAWATDLVRKRPGLGGAEIRLPTEAEWEYGCRAGSTTLYAFGDDPEELAKHGNVADASFRAKTGKDWGIQADDEFAFTAPAGRFRSNAFGLYDMHGNVVEWCQDWYSVNAYTNTSRADPQGPASGPDRVVRGGSWYNFPQDCRSASRDGGAPGDRNDFLGFRAAGSVGR